MLHLQECSCDICHINQTCLVLVDDKQDDICLCIQCINKQYEKDIQIRKVMRGGEV